MRLIVFAGLFALGCNGGSMLNSIAERMGPDPDDGRTTVMVDDVSKYMEQKDVPKRKGQVVFIVTKFDSSMEGTTAIEASNEEEYNGFYMSYRLKGRLSEGKPSSKHIGIAELTNFEITYTDDWLESRTLTEHDVDRLIEELYDPSIKVTSCGVSIPGGEMIQFSYPMRMLIILGEKARKPLHAKLADPRIRNEVALILGAIGDESTIPLLIDIQPETLPPALADMPYSSMGPCSIMSETDRWNCICANFALCHLTGQCIGRSRYGTDVNANYKSQWQAWQQREGKTFRLPAVNPYATWFPQYPRLTEDWAKTCRTTFEAGAIVGKLK